MIRTFFGNPGCGKTTLACKFLLKDQKRYNHTIANFRHSVPNSYFYENIDDLGLWTPPHYSKIIWDEAGIEFNNRSFKSLPKPCIAWHKKHRHAHIDIDIFSQAWDDVDITLRRLSTELWYMKKIGPWTLCRRVYKRVGVDKETHQIVDFYDMASPLWLLVFPFQKNWTLTFRPFYYKYFDSWELGLPVKMPISTEAVPVEAEGNDNNIEDERRQDNLIKEQ